MKNLESIIIRVDGTVKKALDQLNESDLKILLLVDDRDRLLRTITDGDIRRLLLSGSGIGELISVLPEQPPIVCSELDSESIAIGLMNEYKVNFIPVVDQENKVISIYCRNDTQENIQLSIPHMGTQEMDFIDAAFETNWIAPLGPNVDAFESELAEEVGGSYAAALSSGTAGIHLALVLLDVKHDDVVFCSSYTFVASANPILYQGAVPVFIDAEPETWNMSPKALERALLDSKRKGKLPKAVIIVNIYGQSADMDKLLQLCDAYGVPVIEDAAESLGATYKGKSSGTLGRIGVYSFNGNKIITTSGGGMLVSNDVDLVEQARFLSTQARDNAPFYLHTQLGYNYRMSNVLAGIGRGQLKVLAERVEQRRAIFSRYKEAFVDIESIELMPEATYGQSNHWLSCVLINPEMTDLGVSDILNELSKEKIEGRFTWRPMHLQPLYCQFDYYEHNEGISTSDALFDRGICLPSASSMTVSQQNRVIETLKIILEG